jgi:hypothetical protein
LILTRFGETAASSVGVGSEEDAGDGPYDFFNAKVGATTLSAYEGPMARLGAGPEAVARVIERAITTRRPRPRYKVTASARVLMAQRSLVSDRAWDALMRTQYPRPGQSG